MTDETTKPVVTQATLNLRAERAAGNIPSPPSQAVVSQDLVPVPPLASEIPPQAPAFASFRGEPEFATSLADRGGTSANPQAWLYASDDGSIEVVLNRDCQRAGELISAGWTEEPLYPASAIEAAQIAARNDALDEAAKACEALKTCGCDGKHGRCNADDPYDYAADTIRSLRTPSQHQEEQ